jgi:hypothetical protein
MLAHPRRVSLLLMASLLGAAGLTACGNDDADSLPPPADPPATSDQSAEEISLTPEEEQAVEEAKSKFDEFMNAYVDEAISGEPFDTPMGPVIGGAPLEHLEYPLVGEIQPEFVERFNNGYVADGELGWDFLRVEDIDLDRMVDDKNVPAVWLRYCIDATDWQIVESDSGEVVEQPGDREAAIFRAVWYDDDGGARAEGWRIAEREWTGESC